jgi:tRNA pseudouridine32 synthase/23S rRNA pseudouridine746 synthase
VPLDTAWYRPPADPFLVVVYADRDVIVVDKPPGLLSLPGRGPGLEDSALTRVRRDHPGAFDVHRLDLDTSGLLLFARRRAAERELKRQFREREVRKTYHALVAGRPVGEAGTIGLPLGPDPDAPGRHRVDPEGGKAARTEWRVVASSGDRSLLALSPTTGRSHQLRLHLRALGHPILGDRFYAPPAVVAMAPRLCLHASALRFRQPWSGAEVTVESVVPFAPELTCG